MVKKMVLALLMIIALLVLGVVVYLQQPKFGTLPEGSRLEKIKSSSNYVDGKFQNLVPTTIVVKERSSVSLWWESFFAKRERLTPVDSIPAVKLVGKDKINETLYIKRLFCVSVLFLYHKTVGMWKHNWI